MPNWCENQLSISGKKYDMDKFIDVINENGEYKLLTNLYPMPSELDIESASMRGEEYWTEQQRANKEKYGFTDWYSWRIHNWGCKWPESDLSVSQEYGTAGMTSDGTTVFTIAFRFETPWGPPIEAFEKISNDYPELLFCLYFEEPGMGFCGERVWGNGELVSSTDSELVNRFFDEPYLYEHTIIKK